MNLYGRALHMLGLQHWKEMLCLLYTLLCLFVFSSGEIQTCSVNRRRFGDRIHAYRYPEECSKSVNPCKQVNGAWRNLKRNCTCVCGWKRWAYREDLRTCVRNENNRKGCNVLFQGEGRTSSLRLFNNLSSLKLKIPPKENCSVIQGGASYVDVNGWRPLNVSRSPFTIQQGVKKQAQFLVWNGAPVHQLFGRIVKVAVQCQPLSGSQTLRKSCIVFKVEGSTSLPCPFQTSTASSPATTFSTALMTNASINSPTPSTSNETVSQATEKPITDIATVTFPTTLPSKHDNNEKQAAGTGEPEGLPPWLIGVLAGASVTATLVITVIIWMCCKMKRRSRSKKKKGLQTGKPRHHREPGSRSPFAPGGGGQGTDEAGYARIGSPSPRNGYAQLKPLPHRTSSEYQRLLKPGEDTTGYLIPLEQRESRDNARADVYTEAGTDQTRRRPKSKDYDYAKPDGMACVDNSKPFIVVQPTRNTCDPVNASGADSNKEEAGYVGTRRCNGDDHSEPASPIYRIVEGPGSPPKCPVSVPGQAPAESGPDDPQSGYIEVLPETGTQSDSFASKAET